MAPPSGRWSQKPKCTLKLRAASFLRCVQALAFVFESGLLLRLSPFMMPEQALHPGCNLEHSGIVHPNT